MATRAEALRGMSKVAVSMGRTIAALQGRIAQGARVAPEILADMHANRALTSTPRAARGIALRAAETVADQRTMHRAASNPVVQGTRARLGAGWDAAVEQRSGVFDRKSPLPYHYDHGAAGRAQYPLGYTSEHVESLMGNSQLHDPKQLLGKPLNVPAQSGVQTNVTQVTRPGRKRA